MNLPSVTGKKWIFKSFNNNDVNEFIEKYSLNEITARLIAIRKKNIDNINLFLNPTIKNLLPNPLKLKDMNKAVERSFDAISKNETLGIFGDYDVDGATSTALLAKYFSEIKQNFHIYVPDRKKEGYGPTIEGFNNLIKLDTKVIFTVDCGTLSFDPIENAKNKNVDVIVIDHHQSEIKLPKAHAIINPNRLDDTSDLKYLCAAGVCFMYLIALNKKLRDTNWFKLNNIKEPNILNYLDLVSLGTVCDLVPLIGLNRAFVKQGLKVMKKRTNLGLKTLYDLNNKKSEPSTYDLGFVIGPRINAGGRVGKSSHGSELLISDDPSKSFKLATELNKYNEERKTIEVMLSEKIFSSIKKYHNHPVLVLAGTNWHEGIIGIIAARIKEKYNKPTILISITSGIGKGSARSIVGFDIGSNIIKAAQLKIIIKGGGHKMAGGFSIEEKNIDKFRDFMIKNFEKSKPNISDQSKLYIDTTIAPSAINEDFFNDINSLSPFGSGNSEPRFIVENIKIIKSFLVGKNHIRSILCGSDGSSFNTLTWNAVNTPLEKILLIDKKKKFNIAGLIKLNEWSGQKKIEFIIEDISAA